MSESAKVIALHRGTRIVSEIPRHYLDLFPDFKELSAEEVNRRQRGREKKLFGEYITPQLKPEAAPSGTTTKEGEK